MLENVEKKLREARFFLGKMIEQEGMASGGQFDGYLSAFLSAGMSVRGAFHVKQDRNRNKAVKKWKEDWEARLTPEQKRLWDFMRKDRNREVHRGGSTPSVKTEMKELKAGTYFFGGAKHDVIGPPDVPLASVPFPAYCFTVDGTDRKVTEACGEYLALLEEMVAKFKADRT